MKSKFCLLALVFAYPLATICTAESASGELARNTPQVVAEVNAKTIRKDELNLLLKERHGDKLKQLSETDLRQLRKQLLTKIIERELLFQAANAQNILPPTTDPATKTTDLNSRAYREQVVEYFLNNAVLKNIEVSEDDLFKEYTKSRESLRVPEEIKVRHILFKLPAESTDEERAKIFTKAGQVLAQARQAKVDFAKLAKEYSEGISQYKGGDLGYITRNQMPEAFASAAFALEPGQVSELIQSDLGVHIIKVEERRGNSIPTYEEVREQLSKKLLHEKKMQTLNDYLKTLNSRSKVIVYLY